MKEKPKLGSLFDGSGGFPLAGIRAGMDPVWASEIEPFPIRVTRRNIPEMKHLGDVKRLNGAELEPVDVITFGSPCQNLSVAGDHTGLSGDRSGLFMEAIRIIKEMRKATNGKYPRFAVWENVPGAFSSNQGEDFRKVIQSFAGIKEEISVPSAKWKTAGAMAGNGWSLAWRVLDAQYWGVPQRRRRIYLIADFSGGRAAEILFDRKGLSGNPEKGQRKRENPSGNSGINPSETGGIAVESNPTDGRIKLKSPAVCQTLLARMGTGGNMVPLVLASGQTNAELYEGLCPTLTCHHEHPIVTDPPYVLRRLTPLECCRLQGFPDEWCQGLTNDNPTEDEIQFWKKVFQDFGSPKTESAIRRWLKNPHAESAEYKMWGNGIALPCAEFVLKSIALYL